MSVVMFNSTEKRDKSASHIARYYTDPLTAWIWIVIDAYDTHEIRTRYGLSIIVSDKKCQLNPHIMNYEVPVENSALGDSLRRAGWKNLVGRDDCNEAACLASIMVDDERQLFGMIIIIDYKIIKRNKLGNNFE